MLDDQVKREQSHSIGAFVRVVAAVKHHQGASAQLVVHELAEAHRLAQIQRTKVGKEASIHEIFIHTHEHLIGLVFMRQL